MKLALNQQHLSLAPFEIELPKFSLVTGLNGSGKSQLLKAVSTGPIQSFIQPFSGPGNDTPMSGQQIALFTASDFSISLEANYEQYNNVAMREEAASFAEVKFAALRQEWYDWAREKEIAKSDLIELTKQAHRSNRGERERLISPERNGVIVELANFLQGLSSRAVAQLYGSIKELITHAAKRLDMPEYLLDYKSVSRGVSDPSPVFSTSIAATFSRYRDRLLINDLHRLAAEDGRGPEMSPLTAAEFEDRFGRPPWTVLNEILLGLGLEAEFLPPKPFETSPYFPVMATRAGATFSPAELSSGERIILNLALIGYQALNGDETIKPTVVLLDEVDAPLHPAMVKTYLDVISDVLITQFGMIVIASTHSPSTIAQAERAAIFVMKKGIAGLTAITKDDAIATLSEGVPTLSVSLEDRRQVFAESPVEAKNFERLYTILKPQLQSSLSLQFIATGSTYSNSSKHDVERIVGDLITAGNKSVYGLIDWDLGNEPRERVLVLAKGRRYALENVILDPAILVAAIYKFKKPYGPDHYGLDPTISVFDLGGLGQDKWQQLADSVTTTVLKSPPSERVTCH
ncbi:AAA family ATPase [Agrobacterium tumefaciens]|uniref:AAA family ATPase n=1 Tax=Agrobacterium tumefaciens TaxID=358 RepID=UPI001574B9D5|nr:AAA family ATPase [Agrobacterium tumefaciens]WCK01546.1 AAA family ATPase [Agrobacterium tumefaciens]